MGMRDSGLELVARTEPGERFTSLAEEHAKAAAERAQQHDAEGSFPLETFDEMRASGFLGGLVPADLGGIGVTSVHDWAVATSRLGRGDGSTAIAVNMHFGPTFVMARMRRGFRDGGNDGMAAFLDPILRRRVRDQIVCAPLTERGTTLNHPLLRAERRDDGSWCLNGRKVFGTLSPAADLISVTAMVEENGTRMVAMCTVARDTPGMTIHDNWDALGMRGSGSNDITFDDCVIPAMSVMPTHPWGEMPDTVKLTVMAQVSGLLGAFLGIAEAARLDAYETVKSRTKQPSGRTLAEHPGVQRHAALIEIDLGVCRALLERTTDLIDAYLDSHPFGTDSTDEIQQLFVDFQATKLTLNQKAIDIVDNAMTMTGGSGFMNSSLLARLYRDVRAGPFMQSYSPNEAIDFIGPVALGLAPPDDL